MNRFLHQFLLMVVSLIIIDTGVQAKDMTWRAIMVKKSKSISYDIGVSEKNRNQICILLNTILADESVLYVKTLNFHWNLVGPFFGPLHALFKDNYEMIFVFIDDIAERVRQLGGVSLGSMNEFLAKTNLQEHKGQIFDGRDMIGILYEDHLAVIRLLRKVVSLCIDEYGDESTGNFLTEILEKHEKAAWMLRAHLE